MTNNLATRRELAAGDELHPGECIVSSNDGFRLYQMGAGDERLVLVDEHDSVRWESTPARNNGTQPLVRMEDDGNLVAYTDGRMVWASGTKKHFAATLQVENTGDVVIRDAQQRVIWKNGMPIVGQ